MHRKSKRASFVLVFVLFNLLIVCLKEQCSFKDYFECKCAACTDWSSMRYMTTSA